MSDKRYEANIIRATAVEPANNLETTSAPGVWSIDEVVELKKKDKWPTVGNVSTDVTDVFSTFLYDGNGATQVITNGIALGNTGDGGSGDFTAGNTTRINVTTSSNFGFGTGDFTIEFFVYLYSQYNYSEFYDQRTSSQDSSTLSPIVYGDSSGRVYFYAGGNLIQSNTNATPVGAWTHVAVTKASGSTKLFINGTQQGSTYSDSNNYVTPASSFSFGGSLEQNTYNVDGFMSNLRVVKGTAVYTSNFTAPTAALTAVSGTSLLTLQGSTPFVDNSGNSVTLTQNGSPVASDFGPFTGSSGEGGLVWIKRRNSVRDYLLFDTERGTTKWVESNTQDAEATDSTTLTSFNSNGFSLGSYASVNGTGVTPDNYVSWTFRKAPKFFDVVTYSGNGATRTISHNLGSDVGMLIVKRTDASAPWAVWHRQLNGGTNSGQYYIQLNSTNAEAASSPYWNNTAPTSTEFTVSSDGHVNNASGTYVAYLFAHNNSDGEFGPDGDQDIIKCGSYTTDGSGNAVVNLGFEPQFVITKGSNYISNWQIHDVMRGATVGGNAQTLRANNSDPEVSQSLKLEPNPTGFTSSQGVNGYNGIYMAIRRGPLAEPTSATDVFGVNYAYTYDVDGNTGGSSAQLVGYIGKPADLNIQGYRSGSSFNAAVYDRLRNNKYLITNTTSAEASVSGNFWDNMAGFREVASGQDTTMISWTWKRAPSYFDVVAYSGNGTAGRTINHNLGVVPEMIWIKNRDQGIAIWIVGHSALDFTNNEYLRLNDTNVIGTHNMWNSTAPTSSVFSVGSDVYTNAGSDTFIAYLFATVAGVSKVGSYTGTASAQNIDCGFSSGARFIIIKKITGSTSNADWRVFDTTRGIVSGNDPYLALNTTAAETSSDLVDSYSSGFSITSDNLVNESGQTFIFYAIA